MEQEGASASSWASVLADSEYVPVEYTRSLVDYYTAYYGLESLSRVLCFDGRPVGVWPLGLCERDGQVEVTSNGAAVLPPLLVEGLPERVHKRLVAECMREVEELCAKHNNMWWQAREIVTDGLSLWHRRMMEHGASAELTHELFCDLSWSEDELHANIRKSYRSLIQQGQKGYIATLGEDITPLQELHREVAGKATRADDTWLAQQAAVDADEAFLVYLHDKHDKLVGGALFHTSRDEVLYAVGVYDRELKRQPLGHVVQWYAIQEMRRREALLYRLGARPYVAKDKDLSIAHFKEGWATHVFPCVTTSLLANRGSR